jgi:drug/metabolite transporter (DMT)-like permease
LAVVLLGEQASWFMPVGGLLIVSGITWIVLEQRRGDAEAPVRVELVRGLLFALGAAMAWATATVWLRGQQGNLNAVAAASLRIPAASLAVFATLALTARVRQPAREITRHSIAVVALAGLLGTGLGSVLFIYAVEHTGAARTAFVTTSAPVFALPMGVMFLSEKLTPKLLLGTAVTVLGIWLVLL